MKAKLGILLGFCFYVSTATAEEFSFPKSYQLTLAAPTESQMFASNGLLLNSLSYDLYYGSISPLVSSRIDKFLAPAWSVFWTFNFTMWPHDGGHWARANQIGGDFVIEKYNFPFPVAKMVPAPNATLAQRTLTSAGGFEINNLASLQVRQKFFKNDYAYFDELVHSFIQSVLFPFYSVVIAYTDPSNPDTWINTYGDPVEYTQLVYQHRTGRSEIRADGSVDPELVKFYREIFWTNIVWTLLDPMIYQSARGFAIDPKYDTAYIQPRMYRFGQYQWQYSTLFNPSALGYELYLYNYVKTEQRLLIAYAKWGRPFMDYGAGINVVDAFRYDAFTLDIGIDIWNQDEFGKGAAISLQPMIAINRHWKASVDLSWKDNGYMIGRELDRGYRLLGNIVYIR